MDNQIDSTDFFEGMERLYFDAINQKQRQKRKFDLRFPLYGLPKYMKRDPFLLNCFKRINYHDENLLIVFVGETGVGKSSSAITISDMLDITPIEPEKYVKNFVVACDKEGKAIPECRVVYRAIDFLRLINSNLPKGSCIVWDEAGIGNDNTEWYDRKSKIIKHVMQAFRHKNYCIMMTVPDIESITIATRRLIHCVIDVKERTSKYVECDVRWIKRVRNISKPKIIPLWTSYVDPISSCATLMRAYLIPPIRPELEIPYKRIKDWFGNDLYSFAEAEMREMEKIEREFAGSEVKNSDELRKFNPVDCVDLVKGNLESLGELSREKLVYFLAKKGYACKPADAKLVLEILAPIAPKTI